MKSQKGWAASMTLFILTLSLLVRTGPVCAQTYTGHQVINGTRVYTEIFESEGYARFSNACGSQTLSQAQLQAGAIPTNIIPCPRRNTNSAPANPSPPAGVRCGNGRCKEGQICTKDNMCLAGDSPRVCPEDRNKFCPAGYFCTVGEKCVPANSGRYCGNGAYCSEGQFCTPDEPTKCHSVDEVRYCGKNYFCDEGYTCDRSRPPGSSKTCSPTVASNKQQTKGQSKFVALFATRTGRFYGVAIANSRERAMREAKVTCQAYQANTASTADERAETCSFSVSIENGCVALSRSHDMYYGSPEQFSAGMSTDTRVSQATAESLGSCKEKGGQSCWTIPESVKCTDVALEK